jgi:hypothetical protein
LIHNNEKQKQSPLHDGVITAIAFGGFLILVGVLFALTPDLPQRISDFFNNLSTATYPLDGPTSTISLLAPTNPAAHSVFYMALMQFAIVFGVLQVIILALRIAYNSKTSKVAETVGNMVFWFGAAFLVSTFLQTGTLQNWFTYWGALIVVVGVSFVARAVVYFVKR